MLSAAIGIIAAPVSLAVGLLLGCLLPRQARGLTLALDLLCAALLLPLVIYMLMSSGDRSVTMIAQGVPLAILVGVAAGLTTAYFLRGPELPR